MNQKRLFAVKFLLLLVMIAGIVGSPVLLIPPDPSGYFQGSLYKVELLENTPSPRLIIIGGSNAAFGVDSEMLESSVGMPVINMGLHGGLGEASYQEVSEYIRPGDIILLMPEYLIFWSDDVLEGNDLVLAQWMEYDLSRMRFVSPGRYPTIVLTMAQVKTTRLAAYLYEDGELGRGTYLSKNFNDHGDFIGHLSSESPTRNLPQDSYIKSEFFSSKGIDFIEQFNLEARAKGAMVFLEFPASRDANCKVTGVDKLQELYTTIQERTTIPVLTPLDQICFPNSYFFDTAYHLNALGRQMMTERIIRDLLPFLP